MPNLFDQLKAVTDLPHGWCTLEKAKCLAGIILATRPALVVEIGVWSGKSLIPMGLACREVAGGGKVIGIDPYQPAASADGQDAQNAEWWTKVANHEEMFALCQKQIAEHDLGGIVQLMRVRSDEFELTGTVPIGLWHCDGNHGPQAIRDVERYAPHIAVGGFAVMDDLRWGEGTVNQAVQRLLQMGFIEHFRMQTPGNDWAVFQRVKPHKEKK